MLTLRYTGIAVLSLCSLSARPAAATVYTFTPFDFVPSQPYPKSVDNYLYGINNAGQIVGDISTNGATDYAAVSTAGTTTEISGPGGTGAYEAFGINNLGQVAGEAFAGNTDQGFVYSNGSVSFISVGAVATVATAINDSGQIVGRYTDYVRGAGQAYLPTNGFVESGGVVTTFTVPGAVVTEPTGINDLGVIVGTYTSNTGGTLSSGSFIDNAGTFTTFAVPGATATALAGINDAGQLVGTVGYADGTTAGFVYSGGSYDIISFPGSTNTVLNGINDLGQVVGESGSEFVAGVNGFIATPAVSTVPEPASFTMLGIGLIGLIAPGLIRRHSSR